MRTTHNLHDPQNSTSTAKIKANPVWVCLSLIKKHARAFTLVLLVLVIATASILTPYQQAYADNSSATGNLDQDVQNWWYYNAIVDCFNAQRFVGMTNGVHTTTIQPSALTSGNWFNTGTTVNGDYMRNASPALPDVGQDGKTSCDANKSQVATNALSQWKLTAINVLCSADIVERVTAGMSCASGNMADSTSSAVTYYQMPADLQNVSPAMSNSALATALSQRLGNYLIENVPAFNNKVPTLSNADYYQFYWTTFQTACINGIKGYTSINSTGASDTSNVNSNSSTVYEVAVQQGSGSTTQMVKMYYAAKNPGSTVVRTSPLNGTMTCAQIAQKIADPNSTYPLEFKAAILAGASSTKQCSDGSTIASSQQCPSTDQAASCGGEITGVGWIICPLLNAIGGLDDGMWAFASALLQTPALTQSSVNGGTSPAYTAWGVFRQLANIVLVIVFLIIVFSQLTGAGVSNYGVKKTLPRLIIVAILINISFFVVEIGVDVSNILGSSLYNVLNGVTQGSASVPTWGGLIGIAVGLSTATAAVIGVVTVTPEFALLLMLPGALAAALGFLAAIVTLMFRQAVIPILAIVAPLAFAAYLLPNTQTWFTRWRKMFVSLLLMYPIAAIMFAGVKISADIIAGGPAWYDGLIALIVLGAPLFLLPFAARQGPSWLNTAGGKIRGMMKPIEKPAANWAASWRKNALSRSDAAAAAGGGGLGGRLRYSFIRRGRKRDLRTGAFQAEADQKFNSGIIDSASELTRGMDPEGAGAATIRATASRAHADEIKLQTDSIKASIDPSDREGLARTLARAITEGNETRATAAVNMLAAARGVDQLHSTLAAAQANNSMATGSSMETAMKRAMTSGENSGVIKEKRQDLQKWATDGQSRSLQTVTNDKGTWNIAAEQAATLTKSALAAAQQSGGLSVETAQRVLDTPQLRGRLEPDQEQIIVQIAGRGSAGGGIGPIGSEVINK